MRPPNAYDGSRNASSTATRGWRYISMTSSIQPACAASTWQSRPAQQRGVLVVDREAFVLARQPRFAADARMLEIVKGGANAGESMLACAQRELREELGLAAADWAPLGVAYEIPSIVEHPVVLFAARELRTVPKQPEDVEAIEAVRIPFDDAYRAARDGRIDDAITLAALLRYLIISEKRG